MKISLNLGQSDAYTSDADMEKALDRDVRACRKGDWEAKSRVVQSLMPLLTSLAKKRSTNITDINRYIECGKEGVLTAARNFKDTSHTKFQIFALRYVEEAMNHMDHPGLLARLFSIFR